MAVDDGYDGVNDDTSSSDEKRRRGASAWEVLSRVDQYKACASEKALNMEMLLMQVEDVASDYAALNMEDEELIAMNVEKAFEFDTFSGILNSEVKELYDFVSHLQVNIVDIGEKLLEAVDSEELSAEIEKKLQDAGHSLKKTRDVVTDIRTRSAKFESDLASAGLGTRKLQVLSLQLYLQCK